MSALKDLKILDFSTLLPGPYASLMLADMGADVLKISSASKPDIVTDYPPFISKVRIYRRVRRGWGGTRGACS